MTEFIQIEVELDPRKVPQQITWSVSDSSRDAPQKAKAMFLAFWDGMDKTALRLDLWTKDMMTDEMADFYYQVFVTMAESFQRATQRADLSADIKKFATDFHTKFAEKERAEN